MNVVIYHNGDYWLPALVKRGRNKLHIVYLTDGRGVVMRTKGLKEERFMRPAEFKGAPYPLKRAARVFAAIGRQRGISKGAKSLLGEAKGVL